MGWIHFVHCTYLLRGFHLKASKNDSEKLLANKPVGTYLLRLSSEVCSCVTVVVVVVVVLCAVSWIFHVWCDAQPGSYGMSCVSVKAGTPTVLHFRIKYTPLQGFEFDNTGMVSSSCVMWLQIHLLILNFLVLPYSLCDTGWIHWWG